MDRELLRTLFGRLARSRVSAGLWNANDVREAGQSIADALASGDAARIHDAEVWVQVEVARIDAKAAQVPTNVEQQVVAAPAQTRVPELKRKTA